MTGRSKSVVAVAAFLVAAERLGPEEALRRVCGAHAGARVTEEHRQLLDEFARGLPGGHGAGAAAAAPP